MNTVKTHKKFVLTLIFLSILGVGLIIEPVTKNTIEKYNPIGTTHYGLPYASLPPSPYLFEIVFLEPIKKFSNRDVVVLIGNSVIAGYGAKNKIYLNLDHLLMRI